uniref:Terpene synthase metal-binding domain-containing protein n=1 Tax=Oryza punctata TaxID=4537 RepID=A0A0E0KDZ5_ORYPU
MNYLVEYEQEDEHDAMLLELARLDFELARSLHLKELKALSLWWRELYESVKLSYARDRLVESYFWTCGVFHEEEHSRARIIFAKVFGLLSLMDDTYDVHATLEECYKLNEAIQRWDESAISILPKYLRMFYVKLLRNFDELEEILEPHEKYRMSYTKNAFKLSSEYYLREAIWSNTKYTPSFAEHLEVSIMSSGFPMLAPVVLMGVHDHIGVATVAAFEWATGAGATPDVVITASGEVARFLNDIASHSVGKNEKDVLSSVECYMAEHGVGEEAALVAVAALAEHGWRTINRAFMEMDTGLLPAARLIVNLTRTLEVIYLGGRDGYTFGGDIKGLVVSLFLDPIAVIRI